MPIHATFTQVGVLYAIFAPFIIIVSILISSFISGQPIVGLIYLVGIFVTAVIFWPLAANILQQKMNLDKATVGLCSMFNYPINESVYVSPAFNTMIYAYTIFFMAWPTITNQGVAPPPLAAGIIYFILAFTIIFNIYVRGRVLCCLPQSMGHAIGAILSGVMLGCFGAIIFGQLSIWGGGSKTGWQFASFTGDPSNKLACQKPTGGNYQCKVYKNGTPSTVSSAQVPPL